MAGSGKSLQAAAAHYPGRLYITGQRSRIKVAAESRCGIKTTVCHGILDCTNGLKGQRKPKRLPLPFWHVFNFVIGSNAFLVRTGFDESAGKKACRFLGCSQGLF